MLEYSIPSDVVPLGPNGKADPISIIHYEVDAPSIKARIRLDQNLFSFPLEGEKKVHYAGNSVSIRPHEFILLSAGNYLSTEKTRADNGKFQSILFFFDNKILADFFTRHSLAFTVDRPRLNKEPFLLFEKDAFLMNFTTSLALMLQSESAKSTSMHQLKLEELLLYICDRYKGQIQRLRNMSQEADPDFAIKQAVTANIDNNVTVEELAFLCNTSLSTFKRRFARIYGTSPNKWLLEKRMERAARLLRQNDLKASEIYYELGYENLSSFIQSFKQVYGVTPKQYQLLN